MTVAAIQRPHCAHPIEGNPSDHLQENLMSLIIRIMLLGQQLSQNSTSKGDRLRETHKHYTEQIVAHLKGRPVNLICVAYGLALATATALGAAQAGSPAISAVYRGAACPELSTLVQTALNTAVAAFPHLSGAFQTALGARQDAQKVPLEAEQGLLGQRMQEQATLGQSLGSLTQLADQLAQMVASMNANTARSG